MIDPLLAHRLRAHRLSAPAGSVSETAAHLAATQAQEFWAGRLALAVRTDGRPALSEVDAALDRGEVVRSWTMRGTLHLVAAADLPMLLALTGERMARSAQTRLRSLGLDPEVLDRAVGLLQSALRGGGRLTRAEAFAVLTRGGVDPRVRAARGGAVRGVVPGCGGRGAPGVAPVVALTEPAAVSDAALQRALAEVTAFFRP